MSRKLKIFLMVFLMFSVGIYFGYQKLNADLENLNKQVLNTPDPSSWKDGTYEGEASQFPIKVKVEVKIQTNQITDITLLEHQTGEGQSAEVIVQDVLAAQSLEVDVITGATYSSILILKAIEDALEKADE